MIITNWNCKGEGHMGMVGTYIAIENFLLSQIINGEKSILEIDSTQCHPLDVDKSWWTIHEPTNRTFWRAITWVFKKN